MSMDVDNTSTNGSQPNRGRPFSKGNPGRRPGTKNKATMVAEALLRGEETELVRKAIELAKAGDTQMLKFLLDRLLPKDRPIRVDLPPLNFAHDSIDAFAKIIDAVSQGMLTPSEGAAMGALVREFTRALDVAELSQRIEALEVKLTGGLK
jgi:hypothetical protein